jgi:class 3 adenylate cyclase
LSAAAADQVLASDIAHLLAESAGLAFEDLGDRELKGLDGPRRLWALRTEPSAGIHTPA